MEKAGPKEQMKAVILAAGVGSRIRPLTDNCPKSLLRVNGKTILEMMVSHIRDSGCIDEVVFVLGYMQDVIRAYVKETFPDIKAQFVINDKYTTTNTGFSLMLAENFVGGSSFIKFDADVVFDKTILDKLAAGPQRNCLCIDKNIHLAAEEVKVAVDGENRVLRASKTLSPAEAAGESIGIEKIDGLTAYPLFLELRTMMKDYKNHQKYYEAAYERLIAKNVPFHALDITGLKWVEIDTETDFAAAGKLFNT